MFKIHNNLLIESNHLTIAENSTTALHIAGDYGQHNQSDPSPSDKQSPLTAFATIFLTNTAILLSEQSLATFGKPEFPHLQFEQ